MSTVAPLEIRIPPHKSKMQAIKLIFGTKRASRVAQMAGRKTTAGQVTRALIVEEFGDECLRSLEAVDDYLKECERLWYKTSVYTGNTRGALKIVGTYPRTITVEFDKDWWFAPKVLTNQRSLTVHGKWTTNDNVTHYKDYYYPAHKYKIKITGYDYAPRIPLPPHGGGNIDALIAVYEEEKKIAFNKAKKSRGIK